jgi:hypothetical protein
VTLHLLKLAVGVSDLAELRRIQRERRKLRGFYCFCFYTRNTPRRQEEVLDGGSIYWVIKGQVRARQRIRGFVPILNQHGKMACLVKIEARVTPTLAQPRRAFQGWRYLRPEEAPPDRSAGGRDDGMPAAMADELRALGLL